MTDPWEDVQGWLAKDRKGKIRLVIDRKHYRLLKADANALLMFRGQCEAALEALEHGLTDAPEGILRDAIAALPEHLRGEINERPRKT